MPKLRTKIIESDTRKGLEKSMNDFFAEQEKSKTSVFQMITLSHNLNEPNEKSSEPKFWAKILFNEFSQLEINNAQNRGQVARA